MSEDSVPATWVSSCYSPFASPPININLCLHSFSVVGLHYLHYFSEFLFQPPPVCVCMFMHVHVRAHYVHEEVRGELLCVCVHTCLPGCMLQCLCGDRGTVRVGSLLSLYGSWVIKLRSSGSGTVPLSVKSSHWSWP